jgi:hypothetical protein
MWKVREVLAVSFNSIENDYRMALDKESHCNKKVTVTVSHSQKNPYLDRYLVFGLGAEYIARQFMSQRNRHMN